jgi:8-oxo-dGTP pyrophosphatase MutT (NUDIX family)
VSKKVNTWKKIESKPIADCRVFKVREDFCESSQNGTKASFYVIENPDWVNIIALTKDEKVILIEQFRQGMNEVTLEIPGGMVDEGEEPLECAERELLEETGFVAKEMIFLGKSHPNPALQENRMFHFLALDCEKSGETKFDEHESIETKLVELNEIPKLITDEKITHSLVIAGFYRFEKYQQTEPKFIYES